MFEFHNPSLALIFDYDKSLISNEKSHQSIQASWLLFDKTHRQIISRGSNVQVESVENPKINDKIS